MPTDLHVTEQLQAYLIAQGVAQVPAAAPSLTVPRIWLQPRDGAPMPSKVNGAFVENATITLIDTQLAYPSSVEEWIEETFVDVIVRARQAPAGKLIQRQIRGLLTPINDMGGKKHWTMGALHVEYSTTWRGDQALPRDPGTDGETYDRVQSFRFGCRRKALAGTPEVP